LHLGIAFRTVHLVLLRYSFLFLGQLFFRT
jgi:hypothetical protein